MKRIKKLLSKILYNRWKIKYYTIIFELEVLEAITEDKKTAERIKMILKKEKIW